MRLWLAVLLFTPVAARAQTLPFRVDLQALCAGRPASFSAATLLALPEDHLVFLDRGFCATYLKTLADSEREAAVALKPKPALDALLALAPPATSAPALPAPSRWKVRFYASHSFTTYFHSDVTFKSSRYDVTVKDYEWAERSSREFFQPKTWRKPGNNPLQVLDEPTNTFVVSLERDGHEFFLSAFHPKFLQAPGQVKEMTGTIDGVPVSGAQPIDKPFDGYDQVPGESELTRNENTHLQMAFELGYGHRFKLFDSRLGSISYVPGVAAGVMVGQNLSVVVQEGRWWEFDEYGDCYGIQGVGGSVTNRVELNGPKEKFGVFYENKLSYYKQKHGFLDGTQKYDLGFMGNSVGLKFMLVDRARRRRAVPAWAVVAP